MKGKPDSKIMDPPQPSNSDSDEPPQHPNSHADDKEMVRVEEVERRLAAMEMEKESEFGRILGPILEQQRVHFEEMVEKLKREVAAARGEREVAESEWYFLYKVLKGVGSGAARL